VGEWTVQPESCCICREDSELHLRPMLVDLLVLLAEKAGQVVSKDEILSRLRSAQFVTESVLTRDIAALRRALEDTSRNPKYIETIFKRGYRLVAKVEPGKIRSQPVLAVLPFQNLSSDPNEEFFAEGIADLLTTELARLGGLRVISRQSVLHLKQSKMKLAEIARDLKIDTVVEGSALCLGERARINAQLIQTEPETHLWARSYDCEVKDILRIQEELAHEIAQSVRAVLAHPTLEPRRSVNPEAQLSYLKARHHWTRWTRDEVQKGMHYLEQALALDPDFAPAYEGIASCLALLGYWGHMAVEEAYPKAKAAALKAIQLDDSLSAAHCALAQVHWLLDWDLPACEREVQLALSLNPSNENAHFWYAIYLVVIKGNRSEARAEARIGLDLDPLSVISNFSAAWVHLFIGDYDLALDQARKTLDLYPDCLPALHILGIAHLAQRKIADGMKALNKAYALSNDSMTLSYLLGAQARLGMRSEAAALLSELLDRNRREYVPAMALSIAYMGIGDIDKAFEWLDKCFAERDSRLFWLAVVPLFQPLRADARFELFLRRLGLNVPPTESLD
jgi:TolB-like protein